MKTILIVDDDEAIRDLVKEYLEENYCVQTAANGEDALALVKSGGFDLLITDLFMPYMAGLELLKAARVLNPALPIVIMSGAHVKLPAPGEYGRGVNVALQKPFSHLELERLFASIFV